MGDVDFIAKGWKKLDKELMVDEPPKISWGGIFLGERPDPKKSLIGVPYFWTDSDRLSYTTKLAEAMNHAASLIQGERNKLLELLELKVGQLKQMSEAMEQNNLMLQTEITKMNENKQHYHAKIAELNRTIRELKAHGNNDQLDNKGNISTAS